MRISATTRWLPGVWCLLALLWLATSVALGQSSPASRAPSPAPTYAALLLSNGKVVRGEIAFDAQAGAYRLRASGGPLSFVNTEEDAPNGWMVDPDDYLKPMVYDPADVRWAKRR